MWEVTGYCLITWLRITTILAILVGIAALVWGLGSVPFWLILATAVGLDWLAIRGLAREWSYHACGRWWWPR